MINPVVAEMQRWLERKPGDADWPNSTNPTNPVPAGPAPEFPLDALPAAIRRFVESVAKSIGCPPDFVLVPLFGLAEGCMGRSRRLVVQPGFEVSPGSWYGVVGEPGTGKSPAQRKALEIIKPLQDEAWTRYQEELEAWESMPRDERGDRPELEHFYVTDSTTEGLAAALVASSGVTQFEDELRRRLKSLDAYRPGGDRQVMLGLWSNSPWKYIRKSSPPIYVPFPVAPLVGGIQPGVLRKLRGEGAEAEADDGWLPRFMLSWPDAEPLRLSDTPLDSAAQRQVESIFGTLRLRRPEPHDIRLSPEAFERFKVWHEENRCIQIEGRGLERQWAAKAPFHLARLALVLHVWTVPGGYDDVSADVLDGAIDVVEYFRAHLDRALPVFGERGPNKQRRVRTRITNLLGGGEMMRSAILKRLRNVPAPELIAELESMELEGLVGRRMVETATKPAEVWRLRDEAGKDSNNSHYLPVERDSMNSANLSFGVSDAAL